MSPVDFGRDQTRSIADELLGSMTGELSEDQSRHSVLKEARKIIRNFGSNAYLATLADDKELNLSSEGVLWSFGKIPKKTKKKAEPIVYAPVTASDRVCEEPIAY